MLEQDRTDQLIATLPGSYYFRPEIYARELERIWGRMWVCVERVEALPEPGDFLTTTVGDESLIVVRGRDGRLRAFFNVCRHRGAQVCTAAAGNAKALTCAYHAWTYGLDGKLQGAPNIASFGSFPREDFGLVPVALEEWHGLLWVNLSENPQPIGEQLDGPIVERFGELEQFARYGMGELRLGKRITYEVQANWKLVVENFMECYHCAPMHPELCELLPGFYNGASYQAMPGEGTAFAADVEQFSMSGRGNRARLPGLRDEDDRLYFGLTLAPNVLLSLLPDHIILHTVYPRGPEQSLVVCDWLFAADAVAAPDFDPSDTVAIFDVVNQQDWVVCEQTQRGMRSRAFARGGVYVPTEHHLRAFNELVLERLAEPDAP